MKDIQPWSESLRKKRVSLSHLRWSRSVIIVHLHIAVLKIPQKNFDRHACDTDVVQNYSRQDLSQDSLALKALAFRAVCVELIVGQF